MINLINKAGKFLTGFYQKIARLAMKIARMDFLLKLEVASGT